MVEPIKKIVICEYEFIIAMDLKRIFESSGYAVSAMVKDFKSLLDAVEQQQPDLVTMDVISKEKITGYQMAKTLLKIFPVNILFLTADESGEYKSEFIQNPQTQFLKKPFEKAELLSIIKSFDSRMPKALA